MTVFVGEYEPQFSAVAMNGVARECYNIARDHGFHDGQDPFDVTVGLSKLALMCEEIGEASHALRNPSDPDEDLGTELADIVIRVMDMAWSRGIDLGGTITAKMEKNRSRPYMHGKLA